MGINKKYINTEIIKRNINNGDSINRLFESDIIIFKDDYSYKLYQLFKQGIDENEINKLINNQHERI